MSKIVDANELVADIGDAVSRTLKSHGIEPGKVKVHMYEDEIRILVSLEDDSDEIQPVKPD